MKQDRALPTQKVAGVVVPVLPLDAYLPTAQDESIVERATYALAQKCMTAEGASWPAPLPLMGVPHSPNERRYGVIDKRTVAEYGYHLPPAAGVTRKQLTERINDERRRDSKLTDRLTSLYTGESDDGSLNPSGGCRGKARQALAISDSREMEISPVADASREAWEQTTRDHEALAADTAWSSCMKRVGHAYPNPHKAASDKRWLPTSDADFARAPAQVEVETALADVKCKNVTHYVETWQRVETRYQTQLLSEHRKEIRAEYAKWQESVKRAKRTLAAN
ncbi:hypothetical protein AB0D30_01675 [Streptomyces sp. NPDC048409]|uniref:hypothetical protein n=1 Tax=Streptomyces sp. NPDC048409 TaxID=3154723 RepID=UPI003446E9E5